MKQHDTAMSICWLRRDLRLNDHAALYHALTSGLPVLPVFIFDTEILDHLDKPGDKRVEFIHRTITTLKKELQDRGSDLLVLHGKPLEIWKQLLQQYNISKVFVSRDYEPAAIARDKDVETLLSRHGASFHAYKDQCIFEQDEVVKDDGKPYTVFTPYAKKWRAKLSDFYLRAYPSEKYAAHLFKVQQPQPMITLEAMGFAASGTVFPPAETSLGIIRKYGEHRDFPALHGTTHLGMHFRFGTISIREKARKALPLSDTWVNELIWRDFYMMILHHFPHVAQGPFKQEYAHIKWLNDETMFARWCEGRTGYPLVDAGMRELNATGFMHNRVRMVTASFLARHLLIDWRWGEAYFASKLLDYDLAANNGGWQWAAGCGNDAAPYFRVFNPALQAQKFDPRQQYIRKWVPEFGTSDYGPQIVEHAFARNRCIEVYKNGLAARR